MMDKDTEHSFMFDLPEVTKKEAEDMWKKYMASCKTKAKYNRKSKLWFANDAQIKKLSANTIDVYAQISEKGTEDQGASVIVWFDLGGAYLNSKMHDTQVEEANIFLTTYAQQSFLHHAEEALKLQEKSLSKLENELKKLKKDNESIREQIEKLEEDLAKNEKDQKVKEAEIRTQQEIVAEAKKKVKKYN